MEYYNEEMDTVDINNAIQSAQFPEEVTNMIWEKKRKPFEVF